MSVDQFAREVQAIRARLRALAEQPGPVSLRAETGLRQALAALDAALDTTAAEAGQEGVGSQAPAATEQADEEHERLLAENRRQRELLEAIFELDPGGLAVLSGPELKFEFANPAYRAFTPHPEVDPVGHTYDEIWPSTEGFHNGLILWRVLTTGEPVLAYPSPRVYPDGSIRHLSFHARRLQWGESWAVLGVLWDTSALRAAEYRAEEAAREARRHADEIEAIFRSIADGVLTYDSSGNVRSANPAMIAMLGVDPTGWDVARVVKALSVRGADGLSIGADRMPGIRALAGELVAEQLLVIQTHGGRSMTVRVAAAPLRKDGDEWGAVSVWHDVTEREELLVQVQEYGAELEVANEELVVQAEELRGQATHLRELTQDLEVERTRLAAVLEQMPAGVVIAEAPTGRLLLGNRELERIFRHPLLPSGSIEEYAQWKAFHPDGRLLITREHPMTRSLRTGEVVTGEEIVIKRDDTTTATLSVNSAPIRDARGRIIAGVVILHDVTEDKAVAAERERLLAENRRQRAYLEALVENAPIGIAVVEGSEHRYVVANPTYRAIPGTPDVPMLGRTIAEVFPKVAAKGALQFLEEVYRTGRTVSVRQYAVAVGPGREDTYWDVDQVPLPGAGGGVESVLILAHDVTEEVRSRRRLAVLAEAGERLAESLDYEATLQRVARLAVPALADYCIVDLVEANRQIRRVAVAHREPDKEAVLREIQLSYAPRWDSQDRVVRVLRTGEPELLARVEEQTRRSDAVDAGHRRLVDALGLESAIVVPMIVRDEVIGAVSLLIGEPGRSYDETDVELAEELARLAAMAIDNARLYAFEQRARLAAEAAALQAQKLAAHEERQRLARELHDSVAQALYSIGLSTRTAHTLIETNPARAADSLEFAISLVEAALTEMRALIFDLRPESLQSEGLVAMLALRANLLRSRYKIDVQDELGDEPDVPLAVKESLYSIAREALHNTVKHAEAKCVTLRLEQTLGCLALEVCDDGRGFDQSESFPGHLGLESMRQRAVQLGGKMEIQSEPGTGTRIRVEIPMDLK